MARYSVFFLMLLPPFFWAGNFITGRYIADEIPPMSLSYWRWMFALILALPFVAKPMWSQREIIKANLWPLTVLALLGIVGFNSCVYMGLQNTTATNALILNSMIPIIIVICSFFGFGERISSVQWLGILCSFIGVLGLLVQGDWSRLMSLSFNRGDLWILAAALIWALYSIGLRFKPKGLTGSAFLGYSLIVGCLSLSPFFWFNLAESSFELNTLTFSALTYVGIFPSLLAYSIWNYGVVKLGASTAGQFIHTMPLFGTILGLSLLAEKLVAYHIVGAALIAFGLLLTLSQQQVSSLRPSLKSKS